MINMETLTHWKKLTNPNYLGAYSMPTDGSTLTYTIKSVVREMVAGADGKKEECTVCHFKEADVKPMILNKTNCKIIEKVLGTPHIERWANKRIEITVAKVKAFGDTVDALRVVPKAPEKPKLEIGTQTFQNALMYLKNEEGASIANIEKTYVVTEKVKQALIDGAA